MLLLLNWSEIRKEEEAQRKQKNGEKQLENEVAEEREEGGGKPGSGGRELCFEANSTSARSRSNECERQKDKETNKEGGGKTTRAEGN